MTVSNEPRSELHTPLPPPRVRRYRHEPVHQPHSRVNTALIFIVVAVLITAVGLLYLLQTNYVAGLGYEMSQLQEERSTLALRNEQLNYALAQYESLSAVESVAVGQIGMEEAESQMFLSVPRPVNAELPTPEPLQAEAASLPERIWQRLTGAATVVSDSADEGRR